ncbi:MAG: hypothetical protein JRG97_15460 [Deltaproteobacteria bacterium]|nr:hypothetical protein [Deltaproteobacteria bacterium]MBW2053269.1 hypothetical protein [Deltaproteobacteria bacterium]MBW2142430.1 hypothetical protein [Deltaproteobacteria bacterium]MBW2324172.1 hypothetical protein [Deltaproteobacteria bacterium]
MKTFEYEITKHPAEEFHKLVYFCTESAECSLREVPDDQAAKLGDILNERGRQGWELVQVSFGQDGIMAFWKRKIKEK